MGDEERQPVAVPPVKPAGETFARKTINPYDITANDHPGMVLTTVQLKGPSNYDEWARAVRRALRARKNLDS